VRTLQEAGEQVASLTADAFRRDLLKSTPYPLTNQCGAIRLAVPDGLPYFLMYDPQALIVVDDHTAHWVN
jgi:hypothetical protein